MGEARAPYYPRVAARLEVGSEKWYTLAPTGPNNYTQNQATTILSIEYLLLDFGRRSSEVRRTLAVLDAAGFAFERKLQQVAFTVQSAYFAHEAALRRADAAEALVEASRAASETVEREVKAGLSAAPELQTARKNLFKAEYDREAAKTSVKTTMGDLCVAAGFPADTRLELAKTDLPASTADLRKKAGQLIDAALATRPDLAARAAEVRAGEAAIGKARADFLPEIRLQGHYGYSNF
jgi:outer membrane protein